jgi:deoxycytidylate deaminase
MLRTPLDRVQHVSREHMNHKCPAWNHYTRDTSTVSSIKHTETTRQVVVTFVPRIISFQRNTSVLSTMHCLLHTSPMEFATTAESTTKHYLRNLTILYPVKENHRQNLILYTSFETKTNAHSAISFVTLNVSISCTVSTINFSKLHVHCNPMAHCKCACTLTRYWSKNTKQGPLLSVILELPPHIATHRSEKLQLTSTWSLCIVTHTLTERVYLVLPCTLV